jgi:hypothetical protein
MPKKHSFEENRKVRLEDYRPGQFHRRLQSGAKSCDKRESNPDVLGNETVLTLQQLYRRKKREISHVPDPDIICLRAWFKHGP